MAGRGGSDAVLEASAVMAGLNVAIRMDSKGAWRDNVFASRGAGAASNTRRCICAPTTASARPALRSAATSKASAFEP